MIRATPFHARSAAANPDNDWITRNGYTLSHHHAGLHEEALAARNAVVMADISWRWQLLLEGPRTAEFLSRLTTRDASRLSPGEAHKALWLSDAGGVRGAGVVARFGSAAFALVAAAADRDWIASGAERVDVAMHEEARGGLAVIGPYGGEVLRDAGVDPAFEAPGFRRLSWRGLDVTVSRWGEHGGFEIWCEPGDAIVVWDRIERAGHDFAILAAGTAATDVLDMEAGVARPLRDYQPARQARDGEPSPKCLGLESLIDKQHAPFNGRDGFLAGSPSHAIVGVALDSDEPLPGAVIFRSGKAVGRMLSSLYSPALCRAIGWARIESEAAAPGTALTLLTGSDNIAVPLRVADLPFLEAPVPIGA